MKTENLEALKGFFEGEFGSKDTKLIIWEGDIIVLIGLQNQELHQ